MCIGNPKLSLMQLSTDRADSQTQPGCGGIILIPTLISEVINGLSVQRDFSAADSLAPQPHLMSLRAVLAVCCSCTCELKQFLAQTVRMFELRQERDTLLAQKLQMLPPKTLFLDSLPRQNSHSLIINGVSTQTILVCGGTEVVRDQKPGMMDLPCCF